MKLHHLNILPNLSNDEIKLGWSGSPAMRLHADITMANSQKAALTAWSEGMYKCVAEMANVDLEHMYTHTQNLTPQGWSAEHAELFLWPPNNARSTMVGDIIEREGMLFMVANVGFIPLVPEAA